MRSTARPRPRGLLLGIVLTLAGMAGCDRQVPVSRGQVAAFGGTLEITLIGIDRQRTAQITAQLTEDMALMEKAWHATRPGPVTRINSRFNEASAAFAAPPSVLPLLRLSKQLSERSDDLFNPAIGGLFKAWGLQSGSEDCLRPPSTELITQTLAARPTMRDIRIDGFRVASSNTLVQLDFRHIQRGFAVDQAIARLQEQGVRNASVAFDGNLRAIGSRDGHPWSVPLRGPDGGGIVATLQIEGNEAAFTAGGYESRFTWQGKDYHGIIDPRTGYPATATASVTVLHADASTADAAATALFIAGPADWHRIAKQMGVRYVMLTDGQGRVHMNPKMYARVKLHADNREVIISEPLG